MKIVTIDKTNSDLFKKFLPSNYARQFADFLGCIDEKEAVGVMSVEYTKYIATITYMQVASEHRKKGVGTALLNAAIKYAKKKKAKQLTISYEAEEDYSDILNYMLARKMFRVENVKIPCFDLSMSQLIKSPLMTIYAPKYKGNDNIVSLRDVSVEQLNEMQKRFEKNGDYMVSRADLLEIDSKFSKVLIVNQVVKGVVFIRQTNQIGVVSLSALYIDKNQMVAGIEMLIEATRCILEASKEMDRVEFVCIDENAYSLAKKLLSEEETNIHYLNYGVLEIVS